MENNLYNYKGTVTNVVDGDTVDVLIDVGFHLSFKTRVRLLGINTPEMNAKDEATRTAAQAAKNFTTAHLLNSQVKLHTEKADAFGRYLAVIYLVKDGIEINFNDLLVKDGYAVIFKG